MSSDEKCKYCNRPIKNPAYIALGAGRICASRHGLTLSIESLSKEIQHLKSSPEKSAELLISELIKNSPFKNKVFSVGGFVRDDLLGKDSKDLDLVIEQKDGSKLLGEYLHSKFPHETTTAYQIGESYPIWRISFKNNITINETEYRVAGVDLDLADTQKESFPDPTTRQRITTYGTLDEDVLRRDFTVNMLLRDLTTGEIIDKSGTGLSDLKTGILRGHPNVSLDKTFGDDPLRMIRLLRFNCKYGWQVPLSAIKAIRRNADRIKIVSAERIRDELIKTMEMGKLSKAIKFMKVSGLLQHVFPDVQGMVGVRQDKTHHSEGDVFKHTLMVTNKANPKVVTQLAALLHDVGKPKTQKIEGDRIKFHGHETYSAEMTEKILKDLKIETETITKVKKIVSFHLSGHFSKEWTTKAVRKFIRECGDELEDVLHVTEIDALSSFGPDNKPKENMIPQLREKIKKAKEIPITSHPVLNGKEIITLLNIKPGPQIGKIISFLKDLEDEFAENGKVLSKEDASSAIKNLKI